MATFAAIDVGSNAMRMAVGRFNARGELKIIASSRAAVRLGRDVFRQGKISPKVIEQSVTAFVEFETMLHEFRVTRYRAVATSALRDAANSEEFIKRVQRATGISIEVVSGDEEARLVHLAVSTLVPLGRGTSILLDIGGGSCEVSFIDRGHILFAESVNMGTVRLLEAVRGTAKDDQLIERLIRQYARRVRMRLKRMRHHGRATRLIGTGGNIDTLGELRKDLFGRNSSRVLLRSELKQLQHKISSMTLQQRIDRLGLRPDRADVIVPAMTLVCGVMEEVGVSSLVIPRTGLRDGVLYDLHTKSTESRSRAALKRQAGQLKAACLDLGRRYQFDETHALHAARLALQIFDQTRGAHRLGSETRSVLESAALLHDIGYFINSTDHQKHSAYLVRAAALVGLTPEQRRLAALVVRYHRGARPSERDDSFAELSAKQKKTVRVLAGIVRLVEDLDREHSQRIKKVHLRLSGKQLLVRLPSSKPLLVERWGLKHNKSALEEALGVSIEIR